MTRLSRFALFPLVVALAAPALAAPTVPLSEEAHINDSLTSAMVGDIIRKTCPTISARLLVAFGKAQALKSYALRQGYADAEIDAFLKDRTQKERIRTRAKAYLASKGAVPGDVESYCTVGRAEIEAGTLTGEMLSGG